MSVSHRIPPVLEGYLKASLHDSETSCTLFTSTIGVTSDWLILRLLYQALVPRDETSKPVTLLLVSFLEDFQFFDRAAKRIGLNLRLKGEQFKFICGLNLLYGREGLAENLPTSKPLTQTELGILSARILAEILKFIEQSSQESRIVVVLDGLDVLLATGYVTLDELEQLIGTITEHDISVILCLSADLPFVADLQTFLEKQHGAFLISMAHLSNLIISLRPLESGTAKDVSGVLRATINYNCYPQCELENKELLYYIGVDSNIKIFERGQT